VRVTRIAEGNPLDARRVREKAVVVFLIIWAVVKVRGLGGLSPLLPFEPPCNSMSSPD